MTERTADRRYARRKSVRMPVRFRLLSGVYDVDSIALSEDHDGQIRDLGTRGLCIEAECSDPASMVSLLSRSDVRVYLQWELRPQAKVGVAALPVWSEAQAGLSSIVAGLRFVDIRLEDQHALRDFVEAPRGPGSG